MMIITQTLANEVGVQPACKALAVSRAGYYRARKPLPFPKNKSKRPAPPRALPENEKTSCSRYPALGALCGHGSAGNLLHIAG